MPSLAPGVRSETKFSREFQVAAMQALPVRLWRQNSGVVRTATGGVLHGAPAGAADLTGVITEGPFRGRRVEVELKSAHGRVRAEQETWAARMAEWGVCYALIRDSGDLGEAVGVLRDAIRTLAAH